MKILKNLILLAALLLPGCGGGLFGAIAGGDVTDAFISRAAGFNDRALDGLESAEAFLQEKTDRLARSKCKFPYTALLRYGCKSEANRAAVESDCGLAVKCTVAATVDKPPPGPPREAAR